MGTAYSSALAGVYSASGTWSPAGIPGSGDTLTIAHAITADDNFIIGHSPGLNDATAAILLNTGGSLTIKAGKTFIVKGDIKKAANGCKVILQPGASLKFDASSAAVPSGSYYFLKTTGHNKTGTILECSGTAQSRCVVSSILDNGAWAGVIGSTFIQDGQTVATYTDFSNLGDATRDSFIPYLAAAGHKFTFDNCTFDNCGRIKNAIAIPDSTTFRFKNCKSTNSKNAVSLYLNPAGAMTAGERLVQFCSFDKLVYMLACAGFTITDNVMLQSITGTITALASVFKQNYCRSNSQATHVGVIVPLIHDCYISKLGAIDNPHFAGFSNNLSASVSGCVFDAPDANFTSDGGDCVSIYASTTPVVVSAVYNLVIPVKNGPSAGLGAGTMVSALGGANATVIADHNTYCTKGSNLGVRCGETYTPHSGMYTSVRSNLAWAPASGANQWAFCNINTLTTDAALPGTLDYNNAYNQSHQIGANSKKGYRGNFSYQPGTHDKYENPQFVDPTRNICTWGTSKGADGTHLGAEALLTANPALVVDLLAYVKAGFVPRNRLLKGAAHDNGDIGAMNVGVNEPMAMLISLW